MLLALAFTSVLAAQVVRPQPGPTQPPPRPARPADKPLPAGQRIEVRDGDTIVLDPGVRVRTVRRHRGNARIVYDAANAWLVVLLDEETDAAAADGTVDAAYTLRQVSGTWPLGARWEGAVTWEEYGLILGPQRGFGLDAGSARIQFISGPPSVPNEFLDSAAVQMSYRGFGAMTQLRATFDEAEKEAIANAARSTASTTVVSGTAPNGARVGLSGGIVGSVPGGLPDAPPPPPAPNAPLRVGGTIRQPERLVYVPPVTPDQARQAGITGVVILEVTIAPDGSVTNAKVLRSLPMLEAAALECVRQWRYQPTLLNGTPVPVIMTVTVNFQ